MNWLIELFSSSIGKKLLMAATGLCFCGFLTAHLAGNFTLYGGADSFNAYAGHLQSLGPVLRIFEAGLVAMLCIHVSMGTIMFIRNRQARPRNYEVTVSAGAKTLSSVLMPYTGLYLLAFIGAHLNQFTLADKTGTTIADLVTKDFHQPAYVVMYLVSMLVVGLHVRHGFWSAFQTFGLNHPKYMPAIRTFSVIFALLVGLGFGSIPIFVVLT